MRVALKFLEISRQQMKWYFLPTQIGVTISRLILWARIWKCIYTITFNVDTYSVVTFIASEVAFMLNIQSVCAIGFKLNIILATNGKTLTYTFASYKDQLFAMNGKSYLYNWSNMQNTTNCRNNCYSSKLSM